jgi:hypothetical protein
MRHIDWQASLKIATWKPEMRLRTIREIYSVEALKADGNGSKLCASA